MPLFYFKPLASGIDWETQSAIEWLDKNIGKKCYADIERETGVRTPNQNAALHLYFDLLAKELNDGGFPIQKVLSKYAVELDWSGNSVKELLWRPVQKALTSKVSTTELDKISDIDLVYEHINRFVGKLGIHVPWPNNQNK